MGSSSYPFGIIRAIAISGNRIQQSTFFVRAIASTVSQSTAVAYGVQEYHGSIKPAHSIAELRQLYIRILGDNFDFPIGVLPSQSPKLIATIFVFLNEYELDRRACPALPAPSQPNPSKPP